MRLHEARALFQAGRFSESLSILESGTSIVSERLESDILRIELLERVGQYEKGKHLAERMLRSRTLPVHFQSDCRLALGQIDRDEGRIDRALAHFQAALELAKQAKDHSRGCWIQLRLMLASCGSMTPEASSPVVASTRLEVRRLGEPRALAALHLFVGQIANKHGALRMARRHTLLGLRLLESAPNLWLRAFGENNLLALSIIDCDFETGLRHATAGLQAAEMSGAASVRRALVGNLGNLYALEGSWDKARSYYRESVSANHWNADVESGVQESLARMHLLDGHTDEARECLDAIDAAALSEKDASRYVHRHSRLTRALLYLHEGRYDETLRQTEQVMILAEHSGDRLLKAVCELAQAETYALQGREQELGALLDDLRPEVPRLTLDCLGQYERIVGSALAVKGSEHCAGHFARAARIFDALRHRPGQIQLERSILLSDRLLQPGRPAMDADPFKVAHGARVVQDVLALLLHVGRPELLAADVVEVLASTGCVARATAIARGDDGHVENLAAHAAPIGDRPATTLPSRTYLMGRARNRSVEVTCEPLHTVEAVATVNAVASLLDVVRDLDAARTEREERLGLWPADELPDADDDALITGAMRDVMRLARKVAPTNASVLITGESGTGKEIVARALHRFSNRAHAPFVPFNCNAVPKDLLESHLFGYRRGAFTGAERDHPGAVRTAKEGTLFLDEIGELGLELQPKLLRFLESGEIHPLGESEPIRVATRIVAATNANLDTLVQEGRFRTDLFYRLRVVPLWVPPLRERRDEVPFLARHFVTKAAAEYGKGHLQLSDETIELLVLYSWPGNVRQLNNELRRVVALADNDSTLTAEALSPEIRRGRPGVGIDDGAMTISLHETLATALGRVEREMITSALKTHQGRLDEAARALGISRKGLYLKRLRLGL